MARKDASPEEKKRDRDRMRQWNRRRVERLLADPNTLLCACGCGEKVTSAFRGAKYAKGHWTLGQEFQSTEKAKVSPTICDLAWAAGFLEGEGSFASSTGSGGYPVIRIQAGQTDEPWPIHHLQKLFGGSVFRRAPYKGGRPHSRWYVHQARARGVMMSLYFLLSPRRQNQIKQALSVWTRKRG